MVGEWLVVLGVQLFQEFWASACTSASAPGQRQGSATAKPGRGSVPVEFISGPTRIFGPGLKAMIDHCHRGWAPRYQPIEDWGAHLCVHPA